MTKKEILNQLLNKIEKLTGQEMSNNYSRYGGYVLMNETGTAYVMSEARQPYKSYESILRAYIKGLEYNP